MKPPRRPSWIGGLLLSIGLGGILAMVALVLAFADPDLLHEGPYCSKWGFEREFADADEFAYVERKWSGFPPTEGCKVYDVVEPPFTSELHSSEEAVALYPHRLLTDSTYPNPDDYNWVWIGLLAPPALFLLLSGAVGISRRRRP